MANIELTTDECMKIFKKYDKELYNYYHNNMYFFGFNAINYARYLKRKQTKFENMIERLNKESYKYEILNSPFSIRVFYKDKTGNYTFFEPSDDVRDDYVYISGRVQNINEWFERCKKR